MRIGIDLDNTLADYRRPLEALCANHGLPGSHADPKLALRDFLRGAGREGEWTKLQGELYGPLMNGALLFEGAAEFFSLCRLRGASCHIVSHRTRRPISGGDHDLHEAARFWLGCQGLREVSAYFEETKSLKIERISALDLDVFVDDLPEILLDPSFPAGTARILFDPGNRHADHMDYSRVQKWAAVHNAVFPA
jgi:hypothetical protein